MKLRENSEGNLNENIIISWNCRGIKNKKENLQVLINDIKPVCLCLQETKLGEFQEFRVQNFTFVHKHKVLNPNENLHGGVGLLIRKDIPFLPVELRTTLQATAVQINLRKKITLCSIYLPPDQNFEEVDIENILNQLPRPFIITGDFNCHNTLWFDKNTDSKGRKMENVLINNNLNILDQNSFTFFRGSTQTHIDLTFVSPELHTELQWNTYDDPLSSDHLPILIKLEQGTPLLGRERWNFKKADWAKFESLINFDKPIEEFNNILKLTDYITDSIIKAANQCIIKSKIMRDKISIPWWNEKCKMAVKEKKKNYKKYLKYPSEFNYNQYQKANAEARRTIKQSKKESWVLFLASINNNIPTKVLWDKINAIKGNNKSQNISMLKIGDNIICNKVDIANTIAGNYQNISSAKNCSPNFLKYKLENECKLDFSTKKSFSYNYPITMKELKHVLKKSGNTAVGFDQIHYLMLKHLTESNLKYILDFYNLIYLNDLFPEIWKIACILPILKPDKDATNPNNYRPIALLSCLCKILEKIINKRLMWYLEKNNFINKAQCGFRKGRSTIDHLTTLGTDIQEALVDKKYHISVYLDLEKAYDTCWKHHILQEIKNFGLRGHLPNFVQNFLSNRKIKVKIDNVFSNPFLLEMGLPQGSSLSVTLFLIAINSITKFLNRNIQRSLFVDDIRISCASTELVTAKQFLQYNLDQIDKWTQITGFKFSHKKSVVMICSRKIGIDPVIELKLNQHALPCVKDIKFLGLTIDYRLTWKLHIQKLKEKCFKALNLLKIIAFSKYKTDTKTLLQIYKSTILPKLEYGNQVYYTAAPSTLKLLDPIHHQALRICLGAYRTTPIESLYVEANIPSLEDRRKISSLKYLTRTLTIDKNSRTTKLESMNKDRLFNNSKKIQNPIGLKTRLLMSDLKIQLPVITLQGPLAVPPWIVPETTICFKLAEHLKHSTPIVEFKQYFVQHKHESKIDFYTDGSKTIGGTGAGIAIHSRNFNAYSKCKVKLNNRASILSAELQGIKTALDALINIKNTTCTIYTDSKSALQTIQQYETDNKLAQDIQIRLLHCSNNGNTITLCWIPSHSNIFGNDIADKLAKEAARSKQVCNKPVPNKDLYSYIQMQVYKKWEQRWSLLVNNKLHQIESKIENKDFSHFLNRIEEIKFARIRLGHTRLTHSYLLNKENKPKCQSCNSFLTVLHILKQCPDYEPERSRIFGIFKGACSTLLNRKNHKLNNLVIKFFKEINIFEKI